MSINSGDIVALATHGRVESGAVVGSLPTTPTFTTATASGQATLTITGDAGATNYVKYKASADAAWTDGGSRSGDGDVTINNLSNDTPYIVIIYSIDADGLCSYPALAVMLTLTATLDNDFDTATESDAILFLAEFGETVTYYPAGGGSRSIDAIVTREPTGRLDGASHGTTQKLMITVANDSTIGISSSEIDTAKDKVSLVNRIGEAAQQRIITKISIHDHGMMNLEIR